MTAQHDIQLEDIPEWPLVHIALRPDPTTGAPLLTIGGARVTVPAGHDPRRYAIQAASQRAKVLGRPIRAIATDGDHEWPLIIHPDGAITDPAAAPPRERSRRGPDSRMPAGLVLGLAGLVFLIGLATSVFVIAPAATHIAEPAPGHPAPESTVPTPPAASSVPTVISSPATAPAPPERASARPRTTTTTPRTTTTTPRTTTTTPRTTETTVPPATSKAAPAPSAPTIRGPVHIGGFCLASFIGAAIAEPCIPNSDEQIWIEHDSQLQRPDGCLTLSSRRALLIDCTGANTQHWHRNQAGQLQLLNTHSCLAAAPDSGHRTSVPVSVITC